MRNVTVSATFDGRYWIFLIHELDVVGQARRRQEVAQEARSVAALWLDVDPRAVNVGRVRYRRVHWSRLVP